MKELEKKLGIQFCDPAAEKGGEKKASKKSAQRAGLLSATQEHKEGL